jgi:hypothetical protein
MACWNVIATSELTSDAATITIGSIPSDYDHLYLTFSNRNGRTAYHQYLMYEFNGDNDFDYSYTRLYAQSSTLYGDHEDSADSIRGIRSDYSASNSVLADTFSTFTLWVPHYTNTTNFTSCISRSVIPNTTTTANEWWVSQTAGLFGETGAISQIMFKPGALGAEFKQYSSYVLYGINGA